MWPGFLKELWKNIESNTEIFNPRKLPNILVPLAGLPGTSDKKTRRLRSRAEQEDARFGAPRPHLRSQSG